MSRRNKNLIFRNSFAPWIFLCLCLIAYGGFLPMIGFYLDDWYLIWFKHTFGVLDYIKYFRSDRPLMGYFFIVANFILGGSEKPLVWQLFGLFAHWISVIALWQMLNTVWPDAKRQNTWVAMLASVFPGFTQHWGAVISSFFYICMAGFYFSITMMLKAIRTPGRFCWYYGASIIVMAYAVPASEFFAGLELIRVLILWFESQTYYIALGERIRKTLRYWTPYATIYAAFLIWRVFFFQSTNHPLRLDSVLSGNIVQIISRNVAKVYQAIIDGTLNAWTNPFNLSNYPQSGIVLCVILTLVVLVFGLLVIWQKKTYTQAEKPSLPQLNIWRKQALILALFSMIVAIIPFTSANLTIGYLFPNDRFLLAYLMGSCLFLVWVVEAVGHNEIKSILLVSIFVSISLGYQIANANHYKNLWSIQKRFFWQIYWRMPALKENTTLITYQLPDNEYWSGNALSAQLNWTYSQYVQDRKINFLFLLLNSGQDEILSSLHINQPIQYDFRTYSFSGNTNQLIYIYYTTDGCMRVFDSIVTPPSIVMDALTIPNLEKGAKLTDLSLILSDETKKGTPPTHILGDEPEHDWCYYFEKAELARQNKDYTKVVTLFNEINQKGLSSNNGSEYYPFIDALARMGNWEEASNETLKRLSPSSHALERGLCYLWQKLGTDFPNEKIPAQVISIINCTQINH